MAARKPPLARCATALEQTSEVDYKKIGLKTYLGEDDTKAINEFIEKAIPLFDGMTYHQIEIGLTKSLEHLKSSCAIKLKPLEPNEN